MKGLIRTYLFYLLILWLLISLQGSFTMTDLPQTLFLSAGFFTVVQVFIKPILSIILFPISFLTGGIFDILIHFLSTLALVKFMPQVQLETWYFPGFTQGAFALAPFLLTPPITIIVLTVFLAVSHSLFQWLIR